MKAAAKTAFLFLNILTSTAVLLVIRSALLLLPRLRAKVTARVVHFFGKIFVKILNINIKISGEKEYLNRTGNFFVCNHLGYIDGIVATALAPLVFIAKSDIRAWPILGVFTFFSDTIFVNRLSSSALKREVDKVAGVLENKVNVIFFPEGTSTNGEKLLPFKSSFFSAPFKARARIVPLVITYQAVNGRVIDEFERDSLCWYGGMKFFPHLIKVLGFDSITVGVRVCAPITEANDYHGHTPICRKKIRDLCWAAINNHLFAPGQARP